MPPVSKYFEGHGEKVMHAMKKTYGKDKGKQVFYATANKAGQKELARPSGKKKAK